MKNINWKHWALWGCLLIWGHANGNVYSSPTLNEASLLLDIAPKEAEILAVDYLHKRKLIDTGEKAPSGITHDKTTSKVRTPNSSIEALEILAQAYFKQGKFNETRLYLQKALELTRKYQRPYLEIDVHLLQIRLEWLRSGDALTANQQLEQLLPESKAKTQHLEPLSKRIEYEVLMLKAQIASKSNETHEADRLFKQAESYLNTSKSQKTRLEYHIQVGRHYLYHSQYNNALSELLTAYWGALEADDGALLAKTNSLLAQLFYERNVLDKAIIYLSQAADFYDSYPNSPVLASILKRMGDIYYQQEHYNLALVYYLNVLDQNATQRHLKQYIAIRISLAATYMQLHNYTLANEYLKVIEPILQHTDFPHLTSQTLLLKAGLAYTQKKFLVAIKLATQAVQLAESIHDSQTQIQGLALLSDAYEQQKNYHRALLYARQYFQLNETRQDKLNQINEEAFKQQKSFVEQALHLAAQDNKLKQQEKRYQNLKHIFNGALVIGAVLFLITLRRGYIIRKQNQEITQINAHLFTHSRSQLNNLRLLNMNLISSMQKSTQVYEQWHMGELIHEPLSDRLRFAMVDIPFLRNMYLQHGYTEGLALELAFGEYLKDKLDENNRLYHFTDANLLYIENNQESDVSPQELFDKIKSWIDEFQPAEHLNRIIRIGIVDYPFLPKAYTAINEKELLDILLMATSASRELSIQEQTSHWVYLKAIDNAPAASFVSENIRQACQQAINQGLVKVHSSHKNEDSIKELIKSQR
jgi:tetratricopeptide (TPR) repeat protein